MRLQSAIFDMDGTLLDSMPAWNHLGSDLLRRHGIEPAADLDQRLKVLSARQGAALCREEYHLTETVDEIMDEIEAQVDDFYHHQVRPKPGVEKFLSLLKMEGVWMYVATATDRHLAQAALRCALGRPDVSFRCIRDGREEFFTPGDGRKESAVYSLLGRDLASGMLGIELEEGPVRVSGCVTEPAVARGNRSAQFFFCNGRYDPHPKDHHKQTLS